MLKVIVHLVNCDFYLCDGIKLIIKVMVLKLDRIVSLRVVNQQWLLNIKE